VNPGGAGMAGMHMGPAPVVDAHTILTDWQIGPFPLGVAAALILIAAWYLRAARHLGARGRKWSPWRTVSFIAGLVSVELALGSSVASLSMYTFTSHVVQHLLLMVAGPPLLALGAPMTLLLQTSSRPMKRRILKGLHSRPFALLRNQLTVFFLYYLSMYAFFLSGALQYSMAHMWLMDLVNLGFLLGATLFWWPMVGIDPIPGGRLHPGMKILNLLIGVPIESFLGVAILMRATPIAPMYTLASTHAGGGVLWVFTELSNAVAIFPIFSEWIHSNARAAKRIDEALDSGTYRAPDVEGYGLRAVFRSIRQ
jgi:putative membrane protein